MSSDSSSDVVVVVEDFGLAQGCHVDATCFDTHILEIWSCKILNIKDMNPITISSEHSNVKENFLQLETQTHCVNSTIFKEEHKYLL